MSRIRELIDELCPDGVPFVPLSDVGTWFGGGTPSKAHREFWENGTIPWLSPKDMRAPTLTDTRDHITKNAVSKSATRLVPAGAVAVVVRSSILEKTLPTTRIQVPMALNQDMKAIVVRSGVSSGYLAHLLRSYGPRILTHARKMGGSVASIDFPKMVRVRVPVPPIEIQLEIVRILDAFTSLEAELEAELEARRVQYVFHASALFGAVPPWLDQSLSELAEFRYGYTATAEDDGDYRFIRITDIDSFGKLRKSGAKYVSRSDDADRFLTERGDVLVARTGATFGKTLLVSDEEDSVFASFMIRLRFDCSQVAPNYYWHFAQSSLYWRQANLLVSHGGQQQFNANALRNVIVPVPSLVEQQRIAEILDEFDSLLSSFSSGLPAEIAARRQQYEYYRDQLLTFKELSA